MSTQEYGAAAAPNKVEPRTEEEWQRHFAERYARQAEENRDAVQNGHRPSKAPKAKPAPERLDKFLQRDYPPQRELVPDLIPEGAIFAVAARPQAGKTPLVHQLALSVATGTPWCVGAMPSTKAGVLILGLERGPAVLYRQLTAQSEFAFSKVPDNVYVESTWPRLDDGGADQLRVWLKAHRDVKLVVIDHWALIKPNGGRDGVMAYDDDYAAVEWLRELVKELGVSFALVMHANQSKDHVDILAAFYGNTGLVGAVDVRALLERSANGFGRLKWGGTEVEPGSTRLVFEYPRWRFVTKQERLEEEEDDAKRDATAFEALAKFGPAGARYGEWLAESGMKASTFNRARQALVDANWVRPPEQRGMPYIALVKGGLADAA